MITNNEALAHVLSPFSRGTNGNDLQALSIKPDIIPADLDCHKAGEAIANNSSIKCIYLSGMRSRAGNDQHKALFDGIAQSKSIRKISIELSELDQELSQVFRAQNIETLRLVACTIAEETSAGGDFFGSMKHSPLQSLTLDCTPISGNALVSVNELLSNHRSTLQELYLNYCCSDIDFLVLASGLAVCKSIKSLSLGGIKKYGWRSLLTLLMTPGISLCKLNLSNCSMPDDVAIEFATHTSSLPSLKELNLSGNIEEVSEDVMVEFFPKLLGSNSRLETLNLSGYLTENGMQDGAVEALANALTENRTLAQLKLDGCRGVTVEGWLAFSQALSALSTRSALKYLNLSCNDGIDDRAVDALANALARNGTLEELDLTECLSVTPVGWTNFSAALSTNSVLKTLCLAYNHVAADHVIVAFADALRGNPASSLKVLDLSEPEREIIDTIITNDGWSAMSNLLCDTSSINATKLSNHTLRFLGFNVDNEEVKALLEMNKSEDKNQIARKKIIKSHFSGAFDVAALAGDENKLLPDTLSFFGKDELGLSALYTMLKSKSEVMKDINENTSSLH